MYNDKTLPEAQDFLQCYAIKGGHLLKLRDRCLASFGLTKIRKKKKILMTKERFLFKFGSILALSFLAPDT